jgi:multiple sugar transport system ATP-binding protein
MARVALERVEKRFGDVTVIPALDLDVADGEFVVLVGPSGCGKTTTLRMIAGLEFATSGAIRIGGRDVAEVRAGLRNCSMVFQNYALYPHMTVRQNIGYGMKVRGVPAAERERAVDEAARILGLQPYLDRRPKQLSGGQRQRVAIGRAIVRRPDVFLFDEPLSNLDAKLRVEMRTEIKQLHRRLGNTVVYVTHDQVEAMTLADRVVVMHQGRVEQAARPLELYERPANTFVAAFIGAPSMNFVPARVAADGHGLDLDGGGWVHLPAPLAARLGGQAGRPVMLGVRPEHLAAGPGGGALPLLVREVEPLGPHQLAIGELANARFVAQLPPHWPVKLGEPCPILPDPNRLHLFDPRTGRAI